MRRVEYPNGDFTEYYENGTIFAKNNAHGIRVYYENGILYYIQLHSDGKITKYDESGMTTELLSKI